MGWINVKRRKLVGKKDKLAKCLLTLWESYVLVEPNPHNELFHLGPIFKLHRPDRSSSGCTANSPTWPQYNLLPPREETYTLRVHAHPINRHF